MRIAAVEEAGLNDRYQEVLHMGTEIVLDNEDVREKAKFERKETRIWETKRKFFTAGTLRI